MSASHTFLKLARKIHLYVGVFISPALLFFAFTGGLQVFSLHETTRGSDYQPPAWLATMAQLHKKQDLTVRHRPAGGGDHDHDHGGAPMADMHGGDTHQVSMPGGMDHAGPGGDQPHAPQHHPLPLKIFAAFVALGLFISTLLGIYLSYKYTRTPVLITVLLIAGFALPIVLALI